MKFNINKAAFVTISCFITANVMGVDTNQCLTDTNDLVESFPELVEAKAAFESAFGDAIVGSDKSTFDGLDLLTMVVPDEEKIVYEQACTDAGLNAADIDDLFMSCTRSGVNYYIELKNYADCTAPTEECDSVDMNQLTVDTFFDSGMECTLESKGSGGVISASNAVAAAATMFAVATTLMVW
mmetsp:Transcript_33607/g.36190  ORF Transcript_33607/g.36190 Transcript_33607/m.36190 type:complete len:183 (+) Transcript_33607:111-659(+)